jgi:SAM-dependent methyltransferase
VALGDLGSVDPVSTVFGLDRGTAVDRVPIERFLARHAADVRGNVLEVADSLYTRRFGGAAVSRADVLHAPPGGRDATVVGDLGGRLPVDDGTYDCVILTQTLQFVFDVGHAVAEVHRILRPGGVLLLTVPGISQISRVDMDRWGDFWRFTTRSTERLLAEAFGGDVRVEAHGNVLLATAFLQGLAAEELPSWAFDREDRDYELVVCARAVRAA